MKLLSILSLLLLASVQPAISSLRRYDAIFNFGDSFSDTGNNIVVYAENSLPNPAAQPPYGMTFFGRPTGRNSNGRLIIDFVAKRLRLPLVPPFLSHNGSFSQGANFAVSGATALNVSFFKDIPIASQIALNTTSSVQLQWFESLKPSLCSPAPECPPTFFHKSLFFVGEFGFNDYSFSLLGKTMPQVRSSVPDVVRSIAEATEGLIEHGAKTLIVPGIPPLGCSPPNLELFRSDDPTSYEPRTRCLKEFNELAVHHNSLLQEALENVQTNYPNALVIYADFFTPIIKMVESPWKFGLTTDVLKCCCGGGGEYNFNLSAGCGMPGATVCQDPSEYLFWDGHFTEATYRYIARRWLRKLSMHNHLMGATYNYFAIDMDSA
ncbi:GDSL esterase/lipase At5g45910 [Lolium perenne]|uniref:GDSL esterase/lipase At5g45910 n=1 Tax=Lolium perenne TaxID=4522 RepID=UPI0021F5C504|nr:GDSL esterase/lipase At5g45910-like [Lolium perenne]